MSERRHVLLMLLFPAAVQTVVVAAFAERMIAWDEFYYVRLMRTIGEGGPWLPWILRQHNEHRIVWTKLVMLAHVPFSAWNSKVEMYVSALMVPVIALGLWRLYRTAGHEPAAYFWPVALLLCNLAQYINMLCALMTCHYFTIAGMVWSLVFLLPPTWSAFAAAVACAIAATLSTLNAIVIWPAGLIVLVLQRRPWSRSVAWIAAAAALGISYFAHFGRPPSSRSSGTVTEMVGGAVASLGAPLAGGSVPAALILSACTVLLIIVSWGYVQAERRWSDQAGLVGLTLVALGNAATVGLARHSFGLSGALTSKYINYSTLALIAPYLIIARQHPSRARTRLLVGCVVVFAVGLVAATWFALPDMRSWARSQRLHHYLAQTADTQPDENLAALYNVKEVRTLLAYLRAARLGPFAERIDALMVARWREGRASGEILPGSEIRTKALCPVETLHDVAVLVAPTSATPGQTTGVLHIGVKSEGQRVAQTSVPISSVRTTTWIPLTLKEPIRDCRDRVLLVHMWTEGARPGASLLTQTAPVYYAGVTRQGNDVISGRDLAVIFNGAATGLLP